jgi:hypothetical protein
MPDLMINPGLARARIARLEDRLARDPKHPQEPLIRSEIARYEAAIKAAQEPSKPPDRLLTRVETLVGAARKIDILLAAQPDHPQKARLVKRRAEYVQSLTNIREHGRETLRKAPGVKIDVPADVLGIEEETE